MTPGPLPTLFVSHGAPTLPLEPEVPAHHFLSGLGRKYPGVREVLCISAHWNTPRPAVNAVKHPATIHDFFGFQRELYGITYAAPGDMDLARRVNGLVAVADIPCDTDTGRGLDHGAWVPLMLMYPEAGIPVVQLSIQGHRELARHLALGDAIAPPEERRSTCPRERGGCPPAGGSHGYPWRGSSDGNVGCRIQRLAEPGGDYR